MGLSLLPAPRGGAVAAERLWKEPVVLVAPAEGADADAGATGGRWCVDTGC